MIVFADFSYLTEFVFSLVFSCSIFFERIQDSSISKQNVVNDVSDALVKGLGMPEADLSVSSADMDAFADHVGGIIFIYIRL